MTTQKKPSRQDSATMEKLRAELLECLGIDPKDASVLPSMTPARLATAARLIEQLTKQAVRQGTICLSPVTGVFYSRVASDTDPYVNVGDIVEPGQTIGLIEAMKVFMEVRYQGPDPAVVSYLLTNETLVIQNEPLASFDPI